MNFEPGSIVKRPLSGFWGVFYCHMGVYVGDGMVIHFNGEKQKSRNARLCRDSLEKFAAGKPVMLHATPKNAAHGRATCAEALARFYEEQNGFNDCYDFAHNNCESFCVRCFEVRYALTEE
jgi:hypothetical protein